MEEFMSGLQNVLSVASPLKGAQSPSPSKAGQVKRKDHLSTLDTRLRDTSHARHLAAMLGGRITFEKHSSSPPMSWQYRRLLAEEAFMIHHLCPPA